MVKRAVEMEGTVTGEHGVGLVKRDYLDHELGETTVDAMRKVSISQAVTPPANRIVLTENPAQISIRSIVSFKL
jgi:hypothetical protein